MKKLLLLFVMVSFGLSFAFAQKTITGKVTDAKGDAIIGGNVIAKGTSLGTITDYDGMFKISVPDNAKTLVFSYTGYESQEINIGSSSVINVKLVEGKLLEEVVVTALA